MSDRGVIGSVRACASCPSCPRRPRSSSPWVRVITSSGSPSNVTSRPRPAIAGSCQHQPAQPVSPHLRSTPRCGPAWPPGRISTRSTPMHSRAIDPDLVVTQDLCAVCAVDVAEVDQALDYLGCRAAVVTLDPMTLTEVLATIEHGRRATDTPKPAAALVHELRADSSGSRRRSPEGRAHDSPCSSGPTPFSAGHWVPDMVTAAGAESVLGVAGQRSRQVEWAAVEATRPDVIVRRAVWLPTRWNCHLAEEMVKRGVLPEACPCGRSMPTPPSYDRAPGWSTGSRRWPISRTPTR